MFDNHHIMRQLHELLSFLLLRACRQYKQGIIYSFQQSLLILSSQLVIVRPIDDLLVYPLQWTLAVHLVFHGVCRVIKGCAYALSSLVDELLDCCCFLGFVDLGDSREYS